MSGIINHWQKYLKNRYKIVFPLARESLSSNRNAFENTFPLDQKIGVKQECLKMEEKNMVSTSQKINFH